MKIDYDIKEGEQLRFVCTFDNFQIISHFFG